MTPRGAEGAGRAPASLSVVASPEDASLAGLAGGGAGPAVALGSVAPDGDAAAGAPPAVRWLDRPPRRDDPPGERLVAPAGEGLWRVAPWPAADELFDTEPSLDGPAIVTGAQWRFRDQIASAAAARGLDVETVDALDAGCLVRAACVVLAESPGGALPARAFSVLAAGCVLLVPRLERTFGLEDGLDHLQFAGPDEAVLLLEAHARNPALFERLRLWGRVKAEPQRASVAYARLADDLRRDGLGRPA